ncbi:MAG TPA: NAD(P)H-dependent oxidoreductase [Candidatus Saccharimonadales bacterium]|nr:NAD(P)H-dependent oxidoreductase [Candidatus Saccharimonadales bacterium]
MSKIKLTVVLVSVREGRRGEKVAKWFLPIAEADERFEVTMADLVEYDLPYTLTFKEPSEYEDKKYPDSKVQKWSDTIDDSEVVIFITPEYNHGMPASIKNAIDQLYYEWLDKPVGFVGYGSRGASDSIDSLRHTAKALKWRVAPSVVGIKQVKKSFDENDNLLEDGQYAQAAKEMLTQLVGIYDSLK